MKRKLLYPFALCLAALLLGVFFSLPSSAEGEDMAWKIVSQGGEVRYADGAFDVFASAKAGDVFSLQKDLTLKAAASCGVGCAFTVDLCGHTVSADPGYNQTALSLTGKGTGLTILADGGAFVASSEMSIFFSVSDAASLVIDGGAGGFLAAAGGFVNGDGSARVALKNGAIYKHSGNVKAVVCARGSSEVTVENSSVFADNLNFATLYLANSGNMHLVDSTVVSSNGNVFWTESDAACALTVSGRSIIAGQGSIAPKKVSVSQGALLSMYNGTWIDPAFEMVRKITLPVTFSYTALDNGKFVTKASKRDLSFAVLSIDAVLNDPCADAVWMRVSADLSTSYITDPLYPFFETASGDSFVLLCDLDVPFLASGLRAPGSLTVDLSGKRVTQRATYRSIGKMPLFSLTGDGSFSLYANAAVFSGDLAATLIDAPKCAQVSVTATDGFLFSPVLVNAPAAEVSFLGGYYDGGADSPFVTAASVSAENAQFVFRSEKAPLCKTTADLTLSASRLFALGEGGSASVDGTLTADKASALYGAVVAEKLETVLGALFAGGVSVNETECVFRGATSAYNLLVFRPEGGSVIPSILPITFDHYAAKATDGLKISFTFGSVVSLRVYVPEEIVRTAKKFSLRVSVAGILYEAHGDEGEEEIAVGDDLYRVYTYRYLYHDRLTKDLKITVVSDYAEGSVVRPLYDLMLASLEAAEKESVPAIATYLAFSLPASGIENAGELLAPYENEILRDFDVPDPDEKLLSCLRAVKYDPVSNLLTFTFASNFDGSVKITYVFRGERQTLNVDRADSETFTIPVYRLDHQKGITFTFSQAGEDVTFADRTFVDLCSLGKYSILAKTLRQYTAYLVTLPKTEK